MGMEFWRIFNRSPENPLGRSFRNDPAKFCKSYEGFSVSYAKREEYEEAIKMAKEAQEWGEKQARELYPVMCELLRKPVVPSRETFFQAVSELAEAVRASVEFEMGRNGAFEQLKRTVQWREWQAKEKLMALIYEPALSDEEMLTRLDSYKIGKEEGASDANEP